MAKINYTHYTGANIYSDGNAEEILNILIVIFIS